MRPADRTRWAGAAWAALAGLLAACDAPEATPPSTAMVGASKPKPSRPDPAIWQTAQDDPLLEQGRQVWSGTCIRCHSTGLAGAPLIGNRELWAPRIEQGLDVLVQHATEGFFGRTGNQMPARGGNEDLSDDEIRAAVTFMVGASR